MSPGSGARTTPLGFKVDCSAAIFAGITHTLAAIALPSKQQASSASGVAWRRSGMPAASEPGGC